MTEVHAIVALSLSLYDNRTSAHQISSSTRELVVIWVRPPGGPGWGVQGILIF
jgi:hypothetical protein